MYSFHFLAGFPKVLPNIVVKSSQLSDFDKSELSSYLQKAASADPHNFSRLVNLADEWLKSQSLEYVFVEQEKAEKKSPKKKKGKQKKAKEEEVYEEKKSSMKTADDVIKRIQWDSALPSEHFTVAYIDRFIGIVEKNFGAFSWEDIASVDYDELAIPKHRIQYFKYKKQVVWDKTKRIDNVFGSTGSQKTILDVIAEYKEPVVAAPAPKVKQVPLFGFGYSDEEDSDEEEVSINTGFSNFNPTASAKAEEEAKEDKEEADDDDNHDETVDTFDGLRKREVYWGKKRRPTHFICLRVTDKHIR